MITSVHTLIYSDDAAATRAFLRDVLGWPYVGDGSSSEGWLIFGTGPSEMGVHPTVSEREGGQREEVARHHQITLMCDDIDATRKELEERGARFTSDVTDEGFGLVTMMELPGADPIMLYQPRHETAYNL